MPAIDRMPVADLSSILSRRALMGAAITLIALVSCGSGVIALLLRNEATDSSEENLANMTAVVAEHLRHSIQAVDLVVSATVQDLGGPEAGPEKLSAASTHERLRERAAALPELLGVAVIDSAGVLRNHSRRFPPPPENYAERDYFPLHRDRLHDGLHIGMPVLGRVVPVWQQVFSRRVESPKGEFLGVVSAGVRADYAHGFYRSLRLGPGGRIVVFRADGFLIHSYPVAENAIGRSFAGDDLFTQALPTRPAGVSHRPGFIDRDARIVAYERVRDYPIVVAASSTERWVLTDWRNTAAKIGVSAAVVSAIIGLMALLALRQMRVSAGLRGEVQVAGERLGGIIQSAMDAIITVDEEQNVVLFNAAAERIFGWPATEVVGQPLERLIPERYRTAHRAHVRQFGQTGTSTRMMGGQLTLYGLRRTGEEFPIDASISQISVEGGKLYTVILRDITSRKDAEHWLQKAFNERREAADQLNGILQSAMDAIISTDQAQRIVLFNEAAEKSFRCTAEEAIGGPLERFIPERFRAAHRAHIERFGSTLVTTRMMGPRLTLVGLRSDGEEFPIDASISQVTVAGNKFYTVILRDITERKKAEESLERSYEELRELSAVMNDVREAERTRIARELHDELAQWLTALKMDVSWLSTRLPAESSALVRRTDKMSQLLDATVTAVRRIAADLRPAMLDDLGLLPSIEHLVNGFSERTDVPVRLEADTGVGDLQDPLATAVYRMVQEALTNVARHARATGVEVALKIDAEALLVQVRDDGVGLPAAAPARNSHGLVGIKERAQMLGGSARIYVPDGGGTVVEISIPLLRYRLKG